MNEVYKKYSLSINTFANYISLLIWIVATICLSIIIYNEFSKKKSLATQNLLGQNNQSIDSLFLNAGEISFKDKTSFVVNVFRYHGTDEIISEEININTNPQKLYDFILQKKIKKSITIPKPIVEDFSIRPIK